MVPAALSAAEGTELTPGTSRSIRKPPGLRTQTNRIVTILLTLYDDTPHNVNINSCRLRERQVEVLGGGCGWPNESSQS
jgi:hypothetical protein